MQPNDGFIAIPSPLIGSVEEGDVIVFEAQELHGGGLTTHRVFEKTERGYITKGDANPFPDQDGEEPPVKNDQIVAEALQINGEVVVIPSLGAGVSYVQEAASATQRYLGGILGTSLVLGTQGLLNLVLGGCVLVYILLILREQQTKQRTRRDTRSTGTNTHFVVAGITLVLLASVTATMVIPAGIHAITVDSQTSLTSDESGIQPGETEMAEINVPNSGFVPILVLFEPRTEGIDANPNELYIDSRESTSIEVAVTAPPEEGRVNRILVEYRYLAILPASVIHVLHNIHPWLPIAIIDALVGVPFYLLGVILVGTGRLRERSRNRTLSLATKLRRLLRSLY
jgi:signal peptidase